MNRKGLTLPCPPPSFRWWQILRNKIIPVRKAWCLSQPASLRGCHGCEPQSFHSVSKYLQRTISWFRDDKGLTQRWHIWVLLNYFRRVVLCWIPHSSMLQQHFGLGTLAQSRKFKIKAEYFILRALHEGRTAQWGCDIGGWKLGLKSSIQETTAWHYPDVSMIRWTCSDRITSPPPHSAS